MTTKQKTNGTAAEKTVVKKARAKGLQAKKQPLSGVLPDYPNDVVIENALIEVKRRVTKLNAKGARILSLDLDWLDGVQKNAKREGFEGAAVFVRPANSARLLVLVEDDFFLELLLSHKIASSCCR